MNKKITYSKWPPAASFVLFLAITIYALTATPTSYDAASIYVAAVTASAGAFTGTCVWYLKKAQRENVYKLQMSLYKAQAEIELKSLEKRLQLEQKYHVTREDMDRAAMDSQLDDMRDETLSETKNFITDEKSDVNSAAGLG